MRTMMDGVTCRGQQSGLLTRAHRQSAFDRLRRVLRGGHAACILVEGVEKPTDNGSASLLCCRAADADSPKTISPRWRRRTSPHPSVRLGPRLLRRKYPGPLLMAGPNAETTPQSPD